MKPFALGFLWLIHLSALIGIGLGYADFFYPKSPFTVLYLLGMLFWFYPVDRQRKWYLFLLFMTVGMTVEWIGVHTEVLFGTYSYGNNFGPKLDGIPFLIGANWALLTFITHQIARVTLPKSLVGRAGLGAGLMVLLDFFLEQICSVADFWHFTGGAGWFNYACWFIIGFALHLVAGRADLRGDTRIAVHLYVVQLVFAAVLWGILGAG